LEQIDLLQNEKKEHEEENNQINEDESNNFQSNISELRQKIIDKIDKYLPNYLVCNSQLPY
jgi:ribosome recycling factor